MRQRSVLFSILVLAALLFPGCKGSSSKKESNEPSVNTWYKNILIYNLDIDTFKDSDGNGIGDIKGLTQKLDYLKSLGVDAIWLAPFQPTPDEDDGYDVADYYGVDKRLGSMDDFNNLVAAAKSKGIKIVMDVVLNHTSTQHPWFQKSRSDSTSNYYSWYLWSEKKPKDWDKGMAFAGVQTETWTYDEIAKKYYFHRFYNFQPDLNYQNPEVQKEAIKILTYWLKKGVDGFRLDAVPFIIDDPRESASDPGHDFQLLTKISEEVRKVKPDVLLLGEANVATNESKDYFGEKGDRLQMMFNFYANQYLFYSLADEDATTFTKALEDTRDKPSISQWAYFLRNHDEIDLGRLSKNEQKKVFDRFGPESSMQLYDRGIRRRLATMLGNADQTKMAYSLLFSLPGAPVLRNGEEIGMGDDLTLSERLAVRTPMQWNAEKNAGFTTADKPFRPVISAGDYNYRTVNVQQETKDRKSLLNHILQLISVRKKLPEIGLANWDCLKTDQHKVFSIRYTSPEREIIVLNNLSKDTTEVNFKATGDQLYSLLSAQEFKADQGQFKVKLKGYGSLWLCNKRLQ